MLLPQCQRLLITRDDKATKPSCYGCGSQFERVNKKCTGMLPLPFTTLDLDQWPAVTNIVLQRLLSTSSFFLAKHTLVGRATYALLA